MLVRGLSDEENYFLIPLSRGQRKGAGLGLVVDLFTLAQELCHQSSDVSGSDCVPYAIECLIPDNMLRELFPRTRQNSHSNKIRSKKSLIEISNLLNLADSVYDKQAKNFVKLISVNPEVFFGTYQLLQK